MNAVVQKLVLRFFGVFFFIELMMRHSTVVGYDSGRHGWDGGDYFR